MENLDTKMEDVKPISNGILLNPFNPAKPYVPEGSCLKVWDHEVETYEEMEIKAGGRHGRVRVLAVIPKKPAPLDNIHFAVAFCSPLDSKKYRKDIANSIVTGRLVKYLQMTPEQRNNIAGVDNAVHRNCGTIPHLSSLKDLFEDVFNYVGSVPSWVWPDQFSSERVRSRVWMGGDPLDDLPTLEDVPVAEITEANLEDPMFEGK